MTPDHCDHCPACSVEYESRIDVLTEHLARTQRWQAELRNQNSQLAAALASREIAEMETWTMANWKRIDDILQSAERTVLCGIAVAHTLTTPQFIELQHLLLDARYEAEAAEREKR